MEGSILSIGQYQQKLFKLEQANDLLNLKNQSQGSRIATLQEEVEELKKKLTEEREEREKILQNKNSDKLMRELTEERTQRLQDLQSTQHKQREIKALEVEAAISTKNALLAQEDSVHKEAEIVGLRATLRCTAKLAMISEKDYMQIHKEMEETKLKLLETRRKLGDQTEELHQWIDKYQQAMVDLHVAQMKLAKCATGNSAKESAFMRGYGLLASEAGGKPVPLRRNVFYSAKEGSAKANGAQDNRKLARTMRSRDRHESFQTALDNSVAILGPQDIRIPEGEGEFICLEGSDGFSSRQMNSNPQLDHFKFKTKTIKKKNPLQSEPPGSKYLGYGLGMLKRDAIVKPTSKK